MSEKANNWLGYLLRFHWELDLLANDKQNTDN